MRHEGWGFAQSLPGTRRALARGTCAPAKPKPVMYKPNGKGPNDAGHRNFRTVDSSHERPRGCDCVPLRDGRH